MKFDSIPEAFKTKLRVAIMAALYSGPKDFNTLKQITAATDGNLSVQLSKLEEMEYVTSVKSIVNKKSYTEYCATDVGRMTFYEYVEFLASIVKEG